MREKRENVWGERNILFGVKENQSERKKKKRNSEREREREIKRDVIDWELVSE